MIHGLLVAAAHRDESPCVISFRFAFGYVHDVLGQCRVGRRLPEGAAPRVGGQSALGRGLFHTAQYAHGDLAGVAAGELQLTRRADIRSGLQQRPHLAELDGRL